VQFQTLTQSHVSAQVEAPLHTQAHAQAQTETQAQARAEAHTLTQAVFAEKPSLWRPCETTPIIILRIPPVRRIFFTQMQ
jgi:hypothetical protein